MKNWFDIIPPHEDIRRGDFDEAVFAADLGDVFTGTARPDYRDPYLFFKKTYLTKGLKNLLGRVHSKLTTGRGAGIVEIQTPFGGGKTHSLASDPCSSLPTKNKTMLIGANPLHPSNPCSSLPTHQPTNPLTH